MVSRVLFEEGNDVVFFKKGLCFQRPFLDRLQDGIPDVALLVSEGEIGMGEAFWNLFLPEEVDKARIPERA